MCGIIYAGEEPLQMPSEGAFSIFYRGCKQSNLSTHSPLGALFGYKDRHFSSIYSMNTPFFDKLTMCNEALYNITSLKKSRLVMLCLSEITFINVPPQACCLLVGVTCAVGLDATLSHGEDFLWQFTKIIFDLKVCCGFFFR